MELKLKSISRAAIPGAIAKAERVVDDFYDPMRWVWRMLRGGRRT